MLIFFGLSLLLSLFGSGYLFFYLWKFLLWAIQIPKEKNGVKKVKQREKSERAEKPLN